MRSARTWIWAGIWVFVLGLGNLQTAAEAQVVPGVPAKTGPVALQVQWWQCNGTGYHYLFCVTTTGMTGISAQPLGSVQCRLPQLADGSTPIGWCLGSADATTTPASTNPCTGSLLNQNIPGNGGYFILTMAWNNPTSNDYGVGGAVVQLTQGNGTPWGLTFSTPVTFSKNNNVPFSGGASTTKTPALGVDVPVTITWPLELVGYNIGSMVGSIKCANPIQIDGKWTSIDGIADGPFDLTQMPSLVSSSGGGTRQTYPAIFLYAGQTTPVGCPGGGGPTQGGLIAPHPGEPYTIVPLTANITGLSSVGGVQSGTIQYDCGQPPTLGTAVVTVSGILPQ